MPRHPSDPGLDHLHADVACPSCGAVSATGGNLFPAPALQDTYLPLSSELDAAIERYELSKDELLPYVMDEFDPGSGE